MSQVSPCKRIVKSDVLRNAVSTRLYALLGFKKPKQHVPFPHPISLERSRLPRLLPRYDDSGSSSGVDAEYVVGEKSDGTRYLLFLTLHPVDSEPIALMLDRHFHMFAVSVYV